MIKTWTLGGLLCCPVPAGPRINNTQRHPCKCGHTHPPPVPLGSNEALLFPRKTWVSKAEAATHGISNPVGTSEATQHIMQPYGRHSHGITSTEPSVKQHCSPSRSFNKCSRTSDLPRVIGPVMGPEAEHEACLKGVAKGNQIPTKENRFQLGQVE